MWSFEAVLTLMILLVAAAWAARRFWRWLRRGTQTVREGCAADCASATRCGHCPVVLPDLGPTAPDDPPGPDRKD